MIFNIAHFCALSNPFPKFFRFFFGPRPDLHHHTNSRFRFAFEENTGSLENRYHIKYTQKPILSSRKPKISQKNPINTARFVVAEFIPPTSPAPDGQRLSSNRTGKELQYELKRGIVNNAQNEHVRMYAARSASQLLVVLGQEARNRTIRRFVRRFQHARCLFRAPHYIFLAGNRKTCE